MAELERRQRILEIVEEKGSVAVHELIELIGASPATVRRDLNVLADKNLLRRTHGYANRVQQADPIRTIDERFEISSPEKRAVARAALQYIEPGMNIILDSGTTTLELARLLMDMKLTIMTNSLDICALLSQSQNTVMCTGGILDNHTRCFLGPDATRFVSRFEVDAAFMGATGVRHQSGLTTASPLQADYKHACVAAARQVYALFDDSKFDSSSLYTFAEFPAIDRMIFSRPAPDTEADAFLREFEQAGYPFEVVSRDG